MDSLRSHNAIARCWRCGTSGPVHKFVSLIPDPYGDFGYACPVCGMDESGLTYHSPEKVFRREFRKFVKVWKKLFHAP